MTTTQVDDGYRPTPHRGRRNRGARCATRQVGYFVVGDRLVRTWRPFRCFGRVERGETYCVKCRRVAAELEKRVAE